VYGKLLSVGRLSVSLLEDICLEDFVETLFYGPSSSYKLLLA